MAASAVEGLNNATNSNSNELVLQDKHQLVNPSSSNSKEKGQNDKSIISTVDSEEVTSEGLVAITELEPEEPNEPDENNENNEVTNSNNKNNKKKKKEKETKSSKQGIKQAKKSKKSKENRVQSNINISQQEEIKSNSGKGNVQKSINKNQFSKPKSLVEDLKLFQNNHLLNQQDPMQQLHIQLNALIENDDDNDNQKRVHPNTQPFAPSNSQRNAISRQNLDNKSIDNENNCLSSNILMQQQFNNIQKITGIGGQDNFDNGENIFTIKKGILWQQQNYDRFHQRLFSRWKKRYFILTTDYLVCFKRSSAKVGRSEMGKFLYKVSYFRFVSYSI